MVLSINIADYGKIKLPTFTRWVKGKCGFIVELFRFWLLKYYLLEYDSIMTSTNATRFCVPVFIYATLLALTSNGSALSQDSPQDSLKMLLISKEEITAEKACVIFSRFNSEDSFVEAVIDELTQIDKKLCYRMLEFLVVLDNRRVVAHNSISKAIIDIAGEFHESSSRKAMFIIGEYKLPGTFHVLEKGLSHRLPIIRSTAIKTISCFGTAIPESTVNKLIERLDDNGSYGVAVSLDMVFRRYVLEDVLMALQNVGILAEGALPKIKNIALKKHEQYYNGQIPFLCARTAVFISEDSWGWDYLQQMLKSGSEYEQINAIDHLAGLKNKSFDSVTILEETYDNSSSTLIRNCALRSLLKSKLTEDQCKKYTEAFLDGIYRNIVERKYVNVHDITLWKNIDILYDYQREHSSIVIPFMNSFMDNLVTEYKKNKGGIYDFDVEKVSDLLEKLKKCTVVGQEVPSDPKTSESELDFKKDPQMERKTKELVDVPFEKR